MPLLNEAVILRMIDAALGFVDVTRGFRRRQPSASGEDGGREDPLVTRPGGRGGLDAQLGGVLVAALKETFDRDRVRTELEREQLEFERQQREADRRRADEALRLELVRQAGERESTRLRLLAFVALVVWVITAAFIGRLASADLAARIVLAIGWFCLLVGMVLLFVGYRALNEMLARAPQHPGESLSGGRPGGAAADWFVLAGALLSGASLVIAII